MRVSLSLLPVVAVLACGGQGPAPLVVGAGEGPLGRLQAEVLARALERAHVPVTRRFDVGSARAVHEALRAGELDVAVETTGFALLDVLDRPLEREATRAFLQVRTAYRGLGLEVLPRLGWNDPWTVVVRPEAALPIRSLEELGRHSLRLKLAVGVDFADRRDGLRGMSSHYGLGFDATLRVAPDGVAEALARGRADVGVLRALDPRITEDHLIALSDGLGWFPPYEGAPVARRAALARHPKARAALEALGGRLPTDAVRRAVVAIAHDHAKPEAQARALLR